MPNGIKFSLAGSSKKTGSRLPEMPVERAGPGPGQYDVVRERKFGAADCRSTFFLLPSHFRKQT